MKNQNLEINQTENNSSDDEEIECHTHSNSKGVFYCDDCSIFLCKLCFANEHRTHKSNLPIDISNDFKTSIKDLITNVSIMKPKIEDSLKVISDIDAKIRDIREMSIKRMKDLVSKIGSIIKNRYATITNQFELIFEGLDEEIENVYKRLESLQKKAYKFVSDLNDIILVINGSSLKDSIAICEYKKSKSTVISEIVKLLEDTKTFLNYKIENTKTKARSKIALFEKFIDKFNKEVNIYEKSVMTSIITGISSSSIRLRRFSSFSKKGLKYYRTSSILLKTTAPICLVGFGLCGLYLHSRDKMNVDVSNSNTKSGGATPSMVNTLKSIPLQIGISEIKSEDSKVIEQITTEVHNMLSIVNILDPTYVLYLNKAVNLKPDRRYMITVTNLHKDNYLEIWCGEVNQTYLKTMNQNVQCNSSSIHFEFTPAEGIESDFNEFSQGLLADIIYSYIE